MRRLIAAAMAAAVAGCGGAATPAAAPSPPAETLEPPAYQPWGDRVASRLNRLANHVRDQMVDRYGAAREQSYVGRDPAAVAALEGWYRARLGEGWEPVPLSFVREEHGFGFAAGDRAIVVAWLDPPPDGRVPVTLFRYGEDERLR